jgi:hypothetical protein
MHGGTPRDFSHWGEDFAAFPFPHILDRLAFSILVLAVLGYSKTLSPHELLI